MSNALQRSRNVPVVKSLFSIDSVIFVVRMQCSYCHKYINKSVKQNRNPIRLRILPFNTIIFTTAFKSIQIVGSFSQNHRAANPARGPHIISQSPLFSLPSSHRASRASFFFLPSLPTTQRGLYGGESLEYERSRGPFLERPRTSR